jgi:hypothetical protein
MNVAYPMSRLEQEALASYLGVAENPNPGIQRMDRVHGVVRQPGERLRSGL